MALMLVRLPARLGTREVGREPARELERDNTSPIRSPRVGPARRRGAGRLARVCDGVEGRGSGTKATDGSGRWCILTPGIWATRCRRGRLALPADPSCDESWDFGVRGSSNSGPDWFCVSSSDWMLGALASMTFRQDIPLTTPCTTASALASFRRSHE
ncbi:unnamed protein product, partial [Heterosigma akashiwo]